MEVSVEEENILIKYLEPSDAIWMLLIILGFQSKNDTNNDALS